MDQQKAVIPSYWKPYIDNINQVNADLRVQFTELENQVDVVLQDESIFRVDEKSFFISYVEDAQIEEQGFKVRLSLTDNMQTVKGKLIEMLGDSDWSLY